jgi:DNA-binding MltR family transcriptional regulator
MATSVVYSQNIEFQVDEFQITEIGFKEQLDGLISRNYNCIISDSSEILVLNLFEKDDNHLVLYLSAVSSLAKNNSISGSIRVNDRLVLLVGNLNENKFKKSGKFRAILNSNDSEQYEIVDKPVAIFLYKNGKLILVQRTYSGCD